MPAHPGRDFQKKRVYRWEDKHIAPRDLSQVPFNQIPHIVKHCWPGDYPPAVRPLAKTARKLGTGHRLRLCFPENKPTATWVILHEMTHALTDDGHGPNFVGVYMQLINKFLNVPLPLLHYTARQSDVRFSVTPQFGDYS